MTNKDTRLRVKIDTRNPVELVNFAEAMVSIGAEYKRFIGTGDNAADPKQVRLYVKEMRSGSIVTELVAVAPYAIAFVEHAATIVQFAKHLKEVLEWLSGKTDSKPEVVEKQTLLNVNRILEPVAQDRSSQLNIGAVHAENVAFHVTINNTEANASQNQIRRLLEEMVEPQTGLHESVLMYWVQARNDLAASVGDRARIESIAPHAVKVLFASEELKRRMLLEEPHPFSKAYRVDVG